MRIVAKAGREDIAVVYLAETNNGKLVEFVESLQPPLPREEKWILTLSTLYGCPVSCLFCDAGDFYQGKLSEEEILSQIDYLVRKRFSDGIVPVKKFKIQFARMGEPSLNKNVLSVLDRLIDLYDAPGLILSFSTVAPKGRKNFFDRLLQIKRKKYSGKFQFQFSLHSTEESLRKWLIPVSTWTFEEMAEYGRAFYEDGERKITLNFALAEGISVDPDILLKHFDPDRFLLKITPVNPTLRATKNKISSVLPHQNGKEKVAALQNAGYEVILSIGELEENHIGSNCGQYVTTYKESQKSIESGYTYKLQKL
jgi:23S rRNA (adenine2503-C2)-methyltransferase